jgi:hypothetical protein
MPTLMITVHGPLAYADNYPERNYVTLMAPLCAQHKAGISGIDPGNEFIFAGNGCNHPSGYSGTAPHKYELRLYAGQVTTDSKGPFLEITPPAGGYDPKEWRFWLKLPRPDVFVAVNPISAQIVVPPSEQAMQEAAYAVGVRFIYRSWDGNAIPLLLNDKPAQTPDGKDMVFRFGDYGDDHSDLEIEYSGPVRDDPEHEDAVKCFENLMQTLGLPWSIFFPPSKLLSTRQNDCKAPVALLR